MKKYLLILLGALFFLNACNASIGGGSGKIQTQCGLESCHGLEISCGPSVPKVCTMEYQFGDFCRKHIRCEQVREGCAMISDGKFEDCKDCVAQCAKASDPYLCEDACRKAFP